MIKPIRKRKKKLNTDLHGKERIGTGLKFIRSYLIAFSEL